MDGIVAELGRRFDAGKLLGYLNFSDGRPDARFRKLLAESFGYLTEHARSTPWQTIHSWLTQALTDLANGGSAAFRDTTQARTVLTAAFEKFPIAYRAHHVDLLSHLSDDQLFNAMSFARACEAVLLARSKSPAAEPERLAKLAVETVNDYVGYRPIAVLETRPQTDFYPHERVAAIAVYVENVGVIPGPHADLVRPALELLANTDAILREEAGFELANLEELAIDPRAADHFHPVTKRPNVLFGEWDPHRIDNRALYRRFILRQPTLDALMMWAGLVHQSKPDSEKLFEAAAVMAGTILMGAGVSGSGPNVYDSSMTLTPLVQRIARYRDEFYRKLLEQLPGKHGERLRAEASRLKQPFAGVRQFLNQSIARERATHLQERRLAMLFAAMGYPNAARERASHIPAPSVRFVSEIRIRQTAAEFAIQANRAAEAADLLAEAEDLLRRGIECGAMIDPWNILGFQGLFPIFAGRDDTVRDSRAEELVLTLGRQFDRYASALSSATTIGDTTTADRLSANMRKLADWWDRFATPTVSDMPRVHGGERTAAARHVANALALWRKKAGTGENDLVFWRKHREGFRTPSAFSQVIEALTDTHDYSGAMALLITWLAEAPTPGAQLDGVAPDGVPLHDASASFLRSLFDWLTGLLTSNLPAAEQASLIRRAFELLEANADTRGTVPSIGSLRGGLNDSLDEAHDTDHDTEPYSSAYEGMTYQDSTDDGVDGALADDGPPVSRSDFPLEADADNFEERLRFVAAIGRLWRMVARPELWNNDRVLTDWHAAAAKNCEQLRELIGALYAIDVPQPETDADAVIEYDRRRSLKGHLLDLAVSTLVETVSAHRSLAAMQITAPELTAPSTTATWVDVGIQLERAIALGDASAARTYLTALVPLIKHEPLLVNPPADGGEPEPAIRAQTALNYLESLLARLPRLGLLRETYQLVKLARVMERNAPPEGRRVSSFDQLFRTAVTGIADALLGTAQPNTANANEYGPALKQIAESFEKLWLDHSQSLRLSALESVLDDDEWEPLREFITSFGGELFTVKFLTLSNIRGILSQGVDSWLDQLVAKSSGNADEPNRLLTEWAKKSSQRGKIKRHLEIALQSLVEHYDEYRDYNTTTTQSDYGENLHILLDYLRLKVFYDRHAWRLKPFVFIHSILCRRGHDRLAEQWRGWIQQRMNSVAEDLLSKMTAREAEHGITVRTVRNRLEERFLHPLLVDQAAARVARAAATAREIAVDRLSIPPEDSAAFGGLLDVIQPLSESPSGVGLDVPIWLRRLEEELRKFRLGPRVIENEDGESMDDPLLPPALELSLADLKRQLAEWDRPIGD